MTEIPSFLGLPAEIRVQIYGYLLSTKHTKHYPRPEIPNREYNPHPRRLTHTYRFHVRILGANRLINGEASKVLYEQNMFIELTSELTYEHNLYGLGVPIIAHGADGATKPRFNTCVLQIALKCERTSHNKSKSPIQFIFAGADLPAFCTALMFGGKPPGWIFGGSLLININCNTTGEDDGTLVSFRTPLVRSLLEPLRSLHSFRFARITGPLDKRYKAELGNSICKKAPSFRESFLGVLDKVQEGDEAFGSQDTMVDYPRAIRAYDAAVTYLEERCSGHYQTIRMGPGSLSYSDEDFNLHIEYRDLLCKLHTNLATAHFGLGQYVQSRKWSHQILEEDCLSDLDYEVDCLLFVRSNHKLGRWEEAINMMGTLVKVAPHLEQELEMLKEDEQRHKEIQLETVKTVLAKSRNGDGQSLVIRYPGDFQKVKDVLLSQGLRDG